MAMTPDAGGREFQDVAGEPGHLAHRYLEDLMSGSAQFLRHGAPVSAIADRLAAEHRETAADRHQHIGVVYGLAARTAASKVTGDRSRAMRELTEHIEIGARRQGRSERKRLGSILTKLPVPSRNLSSFSR